MRGCLAGVTFEYICQDFIVYLVARSIHPKQPLFLLQRRTVASPSWLSVRPRHRWTLNTIMASARWMRLRHGSADHGTTLDRSSRKHSTTLRENVSSFAAAIIRTRLTDQVRTTSSILLVNPQASPFAIQPPVGLSCSPSHLDPLHQRKACHPDQS